MSTRHESYDDELDAAIDALRSGQSPHVIVGAHAVHARQLQPLFELAARAHADAGSAVPPPSSRLAANFSIVRAALRQRRIERASRAESRQAGPWWRRRLVCASFSLPASAIVALVIAAAGATGAAAAVVATGADLPARVTHTLRETWVGQLLPESPGAPLPAPIEPAPITETAPAYVPPAISAASPTQVGITLAGVIRKPHRDGFELRTADASWQVILSKTTRVDGGIGEGAAATVIGIQTRRGVINADAITVDVASTPAARKGESSATPGSGGPAAHGAADHTPGPPADRTPGAPSDRTLGPTGDHTPGQSNGNGNGDKGGNGRGNKP